MLYRKTNLLLSLLTIFVLNGCGIIISKKNYSSVTIEVNSAIEVNYGSSFSINILGSLPNGKQKDITKHENLEVEVIGGYYQQGSVYIDKYPKSFLPLEITIKAKLPQENDTLIAIKKVPFNFQGNLTLNFDGLTGEKGTDGSDGNTALFFRDGKDGDPGNIGQDGKNGKSISVFLWKEAENDLLAFKVIDLETDQSYYYYCSTVSPTITITSNGGRGGMGGNGGDGGDGKDGETKNDKEKLPGDGGDGGIGGNGGNGGNGGIITFFVHENAQEYINKFNFFNYGGSGGEAGIGGKAGKGGKPLTGQTAGEDGTSGEMGGPGNDGFSGPQVKTIIEAFEITE